ncbi:MAG: DUF898 domain-containing protein [Clostridia bacterium]|nr:DUF898 domain-containing protein [Clostridia bacterium]
MKKRNNLLKNSAMRSYFTGNAAIYLLLLIAVYLGTVFSLFIAYPWLVCAFYRWEAKYTYINGKQTYFDGKGSDLFKKYIKWLLLTIVTLTIYKICLTKNVMMWKAAHTHYIGGSGKSYYNCGIIEKLLMLVKYYAIIICTLTIGSSWAYCYKTKWTLNHTVIDGKALDFCGKGLNFFGKIWLTILLVIVTCGIYLLWVPTVFKRWEVEHTDVMYEIHFGSQGYGAAQNYKTE